MEYVLLMLGAPVITVPITEEQLAYAVDTSFKAFEDYTGEKLNDSFKMTQEVTQFLQTGALAYSKIILGKDDKRLLKEGKKERSRLLNSYLDYLPTFMRNETTMHECDEPIISDTPKKGLLVIYINVGTLPPYKAEAFVERIKDKTDLKYTKQVCEVIYIPTRDRPTAVEYIPFGA